MTDYELGRQIARRGNFISPAADDEIQRGYDDEIEEQRKQVQAWRNTTAQANNPKS